MSIDLIVEDGTGSNPGANTYVPMADADAYWSARASSAWVGASDDQKASALIQATQYLDARYQFKGAKLLDSQPLEWPRQSSTSGISAAPGWQIPVWAPRPSDTSLFAWPVKRLRDACCEVALRTLSGSLYQDENSSIVTREQVGPIDVTYADRNLNGGQVRIAIADDLLRPLLFGGRYQMAVLRG